MILVFVDQDRQLLNGRDDDPGFGGLQLPFQDGGAVVAVGRSLLELVIFLHGLIVQILSVNHKQHLVNVRKLTGNLGRFKGRERLPAARGMPDVSSTLYGPIGLVIVCDIDPGKDFFGSHNLVGTHGQQDPVGGKDTIFDQHIEQRMFGKEGPAKVHQIRNGTVVGICPPGGEFKAVAGAFPFLDAPFRCLPDMCGPRGVAVILGMCAVGDNKKLHVFKKPASCPERLPAIAVDLIECFLDIYASFL